MEIKMHIMKLIKIVENYPVISSTIIIPLIILIYKWIKNKIGNAEIELSVKRNNIRHFYQAEIFNPSDKDIIDLKVALKYTLKGMPEEEKEVHSFIYENEDRTIYAAPHDCTSLKKGERIYIADFPFKNLEGAVEVKIEGRSLKNKKTFGKSFYI